MLPDHLFASLKSTFWRRLTQVILENRLLNTVPVCQSNKLKGNLHETASRQANQLSDDKILQGIAKRVVFIVHNKRLARLVDAVLTVG